MKRKLLPVLGLGILLIFLINSGIAATAPFHRPVIRAVQRSQTGAIIEVNVPAGFRQVVLESRSNTNAPWTLRAIKHLNGTTTGTTFRLPAARSRDFFRVFGKKTDPLPASFYRKPQKFPALQMRYRGSTPVPISQISTPHNGPAGMPTPSVQESDIWKIKGDRLYYFNQYRGLQVIDVSDPDRATLIGSIDLRAVGEQMYILGDNHIVLLAENADNFSSSEIVVVDVSSSEPVIRSRLAVNNTILESRLVGTSLYVAGDGSRFTPETGHQFGSWARSFDLSNPNQPLARDSLWFPGMLPVISATDEYLFVALRNDFNASHSEVQCIGIGAANGSMEWHGTITAAGILNDKFKLNYSDEVLTLISQTDLGDAMETTLETYSHSGTNFTALGSLSLGHGEQLFATRFDSNLVYVVTFQQVDPLWIVDISNPASPQIVSHLEVPGWSTYIHPIGDRLVTLGVEQTTNGTQVAVSLFNVSDKSNPYLLSKVFLGDSYSWSEGNFNEKAFTVLPEEGLILVPFGTYAGLQSTNAVQLIDLQRDTLIKRGTISRKFQPRRATSHGDRIISISSAEFLSIDDADRDNPEVRKTLTLAWSVDKTFLQNGYLLQIGDGSFNSGPPAVRITTAEEPNLLLREWALTNRPLVGATVRSNLLFILQGGEPPIYAPINRNQEETRALLMSVIDLSLLPELEIIGQAEVANTNAGMYGLRYQALWPKDDLLVWAGVSSYRPFGRVALPPISSPIHVATPPPVPIWTNRTPINVPVIDAGGVSSSQSVTMQPAYPSYPFQYYPAQLLALDMSDMAAPRVASVMELPAIATWHGGAIAATNGLVYLANSEIQSNTPSGAGWQLRPWWTERFYVTVIDYSTAANPVRRASINVSGPLAGVSHNGNVIYTVTDVPSVSGFMTARLDAFAYDGLQLFHTDSLPLPSSWSPVAIAGDNIFAGQVVPTTYNETAVARWTLNGSGNFTVTGSSPVNGLPQQLFASGDLVAATIGNYLQLMDGAHPHLRTVASDTAPGRLWLRINEATGNLHQGLVVPLGQFGIWRIPAAGE